MVQEGIVLGHKILAREIEVDKAKVDEIEELPLPLNVKNVQSFLGHVDFYKRFIKDFSKIAKPLCTLLNKYQPFQFDDDYMKAFLTLKKKLITSPIIIAPNWSEDFELMCDANNYVVRAILCFLLQGFEVEIKDKKGFKNLVSGYLSRLVNEEVILKEGEIKDKRCM
uniref:Retrovirus-related Pol polyprotein from transposon opus n=1 Tax=Cajanus cajan TaxID=3821 RepID=A0A151RHE0_CAJCA|nr:Retrovirus-related Pol polyprotein from transposon opus [Cajanus cajan]